MDRSKRKNDFSSESNVILNKGYCLLKGYKSSIKAPQPSRRDFRQLAVTALYLIRKDLSAEMVKFVYRNVACDDGK